jgi:hypothetical protein
MKLRSIHILTIAVGMIATGGAGAASAASGTTPSELAIPLVEAGPTGPTLALTTSGGYAQDPPPDGRNESIRYRPRGQAYRDRYAGPQLPLLSTLHVGIFDPSGGFSSGVDVGFRAGPQIDPHIQLGVGLDWWYKHESQTQSVGNGEFPIGGTFEQQREISHFTANLIPIMGFLQVSGDDNMQVIPYGGVGLGYEMLWLSGSGRDAADQPFDFDANYGGYGWQAWGGVAIPLSGQSRINGEVFGNFSELGRDVDDPLTGDRIREIVDMNGIGARVGVTWGF